MNTVIINVVDRNKSLQHGQLFRHAANNNVYLLCKTGQSSMSLVCLQDGNRFEQEPTERALAAFAGRFAEFEPLTNCTITIKAP